MAPASLGRAQCRDLRQKASYGPADLWECKANSIVGGPWWCVYGPCCSGVGMLDKKFPATTNRLQLCAVYLQACPPVIHYEEEGEHESFVKHRRVGCTGAPHTVTPTLLRLREPAAVTLGPASGASLWILCTSRSS